MVRAVKLANRKKRMQRKSRSLDAQARSPADRRLIDAIVSGDVTALEQALAAGANPNLKLKDVQNRTALMEAVLFDRPASVKALLAAGSDAYLRDNDGLSAAGLAVERGRTASLIALIEGGADISRDWMEGSGFVLDVVRLRGWTEVLSFWECDRLAHKAPRRASDAPAMGL